MKKYLIAILLSSLILSGCQTQQTVESEIGADYAQTASWFIYGNFNGYQTKVDPSKIVDGANPQGQNTTIFEGDRIGVRQTGYELFPTGTASSSIDSIKSLHTFRKRSGENILMRSYGTVLEYFEESNDTWETIKTGYTDGQKFGFSDYNINTDLHSYVYFGNGVESASRWGGAHTIINGDVAIGTTTIIVDDTTDGFLDSGSIILCNTELAYSSKTATQFNLTGTSSIACADDRGVAQTITEYSAHPKGNIYLNANNRLFIAGISSTTQAVYFSEYGDATNFVGANLVTDTTADSPGIFNLGEGGGAVTGMALDENSIYIFKNSIIYKATLSDSLYTLTPLKPFDGKSQTVGATKGSSVFTGGNGIFFTTPDNQILNLERVDSIDYPQVVPVSDVIKPTVDEMSFTDSTGIVFQDKAYFSQKTTIDSSNNDVVLVWNIKNQTWDSPIVGWGVSEFSVYNDGDGDKLYFGSSNSPNVYLVNKSSLDDIFEVKANWRSKQYDFGSPHLLKEIQNIYVEGYITPNTNITISLLLDEDGYTQRVSTEFSGNESSYIFNSEEYNIFGFSDFGTKRFGSSLDSSSKKKFRVNLSKGLKLSPFYNAQIEFASEGENENWEIINYGFLLREYSQPLKKELIRELK